MALAPFAPGSVQLKRSADMFVHLRKQGNDLERQLTTGKKADSFGGLGFSRRMSLDLRSKLSAIDGFQTNIKDADLRLKMMLQSTQTLQKIASDTRASALLPSSGVSGGVPLEQIQARGNLKLAIDTLNQDINGRYLFAGTAHDQKPVIGYEEMIAGVKDAIAARAGLDGVTGVPGQGNIGLTLDGNAVNISDGDDGFEVVGATSSTDGITAATTSFTVTGPVAAGSTISLQLLLPDGSNETVKLTAVTSATAGAGQFSIGLNSNETAENIEVALAGALQERASTALAAASAVEAANDYFENNVTDWYKGQSAALPPTPRESGPVRIDATQTVGTGAQADEPAFRALLSQLAVLSAMDFGTGNRKQLDAVLSRVPGNLSPGPGEQKISEIGVELGNAQVAMANAQERHQATKAIFQNSLGDIEDAPMEEVATKLLALQNRLQASYQTTSLLSKLSLVNYL